MLSFITARARYPRVLGRARLLQIRPPLPSRTASRDRSSSNNLMSLAPFSRSGQQEKYPLFINMSQQQYRNERARVLRKLIGKNCKTLREYRGLTIKQVAEKTKISVYRLKKLEVGQADITPSLLVAICDYFEVLIDCMVYQDLSIEQ